MRHFLTVLLLNTILVGVWGVASAEEVTFQPVPNDVLNAPAPEAEAGGMGKLWETTKGGAVDGFKWVQGNVWKPAAQYATDVYNGAAEYLKEGVQGVKDGAEAVGNMAGKVVDTAKKGAETVQNAAPKVMDRVMYGPDGRDGYAQFVRENPDAPDFKDLDWEDYDPEHGVGPEADSAGEKLVNETTKETEKKATEETAAKKAEDEVPRKKIIANNVGQYALLIMEALKAKETEDAIKEVTVKGAEPMQQTQGGDCTGAALTAADLNTPMSATTIADSATAMKALLQMGKIDLSLLSTDIVKPEQTEVEGAIEASAGKSGADVDAHAPPTSTTTDENDLTTQEEREIKRRRSLLLGEWATAATQIGEGSNAISSAFYDRAAGFAAAANSAYGSLGGITTITDTDRFVLFELTRGAALSAIGLGLQGAVNLNNLSESETKFPPEEDPTAVTAGAGQ